MVSLLYFKSKLALRSLSVMGSYFMGDLAALLDINRTILLVCASSLLITLHPEAIYTHSL